MLRACGQTGSSGKHKLRNESMMLSIPPNPSLYVKTISYTRNYNPIQTTTLPPVLLQQPPKSTKPHLHTPAKSPQPKWKSRNNHGGSPDAMVTDVLRLMDGLQLSVSPDVYAYLLKECTELRDADSGAQVHDHMNTSVGHQSLLLTNRLLLMYVSCAHFASAHQLFDEITDKDLVSWVTMIAGHVDSRNYVEALTLFKQMQEERAERLLLEEPAVWGLIISCVLRACVGVGDLGFGKQVHGLVLKMKNSVCNKRGRCSNELLFGSLFIDFYGKLGCITSARCVFDKMQLRDTVVWTSMIVVCSRQDRFKEALEVFKEMGREGMKKNNYTLSSVIRVCGRMGDEGSGRQVHANAIKLGVELDQFVQCSLVDMYGKCGMLKDARKVFEMATGKGKKRRNDVCWNAMLTGYAQRGYYNEAIKFLYQMKSAGVEPPESLLNQVRIDCGN